MALVYVNVSKTLDERSLCMMCTEFCCEYKGEDGAQGTLYQQQQC